MTALSTIARERGIRYFLIAYTDLFGVLRSKLVPASAIDTMAEEGAGFAGFATWFDMTPADPDMLAKAMQMTQLQVQAAATLDSVQYAADNGLPPTAVNAKSGTGLLGTIATITGFLLFTA